MALSTPASTESALKTSIEASLPSAIVEISSTSGGHYSVTVKSELFRGRSMLECHRMVYAAIAPLMSGDNAPVHAIDQLKTLAG